MCIKMKTMGAGELVKLVKQVENDGKRWKKWKNRTSWNLMISDREAKDFDNVFAKARCREAIIIFWLCRASIDIFWRSRCTTLETIKNVSIPLSFAAASEQAKKARLLIFWSKKPRGRDHTEAPVRLAECTFAAGEVTPMRPCVWQTCTFARAQATMHQQSYTCAWQLGWLTQRAMTNHLSQPCT